MAISAKSRMIGPYLPYKVAVQLVIITDLSLKRVINKKSFATVPITIFGFVSDY